MQAHDTYPQRLQLTMASLRAWSGFVADVARIEVEELHDGAWRIVLRPQAAGACPLEVVVDGGEPRCDLRIGRHVVKGWILPSLDIVQLLVEAVSDGRVMIRRTTSAATGMRLGESTHVVLADGRAILFQATSSEAGNGQAGATEIRDQHFLPYRKPGARR